MKARHALLLLVLVVSIIPSVAFAQLNRSAVSINGLDTNPCTVPSPCRSIGQALSQTNAGGELIVLDSAGYGGFTVTQAVSIEGAPGVYAGVTVTAGNGVTVTAGATDRVVLRGLTLNGLGLASAGITHTTGGKLHIENCVIDGFTQYGVYAYFDTFIHDTTIRHCGSGISFDNAGQPMNCVVDHVNVEDVSGGGQTFHPGAGILAMRNASVIARNCVVSQAVEAFVADAGSTLSVEGCAATNSAEGVHASSIYGTTGIVRVSDTIATQNDTGFIANNSTTFESYGNNRVRGNTANTSGTIVVVSTN